MLWNRRSLRLQDIGILIVFLHVAFKKDGGKQNAYRQVNKHWEGVMELTNREWRGGSGKGGRSGKGDNSITQECSSWFKELAKITADSTDIRDQ